MAGYCQFPPYLVAFLCCGRDDPRILGSDKVIPDACAFDRILDMKNSRVFLKSKQHNSGTFSIISASAGWYTEVVSGSSQDE